MQGYVRGAHPDAPDGRAGLRPRKLFGRDTGGAGRLGAAAERGAPGVSGRVAVNGRKDARASRGALLAPARRGGTALYVEAGPVAHAHARCLL